MRTKKRDLIDRDELIDSLGISDMDIYAKECIRDATTVDAVEVVHGQWRYDCSSYRIFCSACNENALELKRTTLDGVEYVEEILTDYCPNCGARMDLQ